MKHGLFLPLFGEFADPARVVDVARQAEDAGWDGLFLWDHVYGGEGVPVGDAFVALAAVAASTSKLRLGPLVTPLTRRRPWVLARQTTSVDHLSGGRLIFGTGLGDEGWLGELTAFSEAAQDEGQRQTLLDESMAVLLQFWSGKPVRHDGSWLHVDSAPFLPTPVQQPRIPVWVSARWPRANPLRRAAHVDGVLPIFVDERDYLVPPDPSEVSKIRDELRRLGAPPQHDLVLRGALGPKWTDEALERLRVFSNAGATWWLESFGREEAPSSIFDRVVAGPPTIR
ncbi:MAG: LLM class flavin-dependent oxidoreductase [Acidimicrobiales bacterium]|jgi:alkanesulfonate monooxygenase SsuD/methylene tetrahydromethanopterin reductase-like flavin-dependent oxidoreductase (luciferase family)